MVIYLLSFQLSNKRQTERKARKIAGFSIFGSSTSWTALSKVNLVGRSYAGALLPSIAAQHPAKVNSMVMSAGTMDPSHQTIRKISYLLQYPPFKYLVPSELMVTNVEKLASKEQLTLLESFWQKITVPVYLLHGDKDRIVDYQNSLYAQKMLINSKVTFETVKSIGHEIPISRPEKIYNALLKMVEATTH